MIKELAEYLDKCEFEIVPCENALLAAKEGMHSILVLHSFNILEMIEEEADEFDSLSAFVEHMKAEADGMTLVEAWRSIVKAILEYSSLSAEQKNIEDKNFDGIFGAYALLWEDNPLLEESMAETVTEPFVLDTTWIQRRLEEEDDKLIVLHLPQQSCDEAPLWIPMGGFNECPLPVYQSVIFKHWQEQYNIKLLAVSQDSWIIRAGRCPKTEEEALQLAKEHFTFCYYILERFDTLGQYANYLMKHDLWYFWWD